MDERAKDVQADEVPAQSKTSFAAANSDNTSTASNACLAQICHEKSSFVPKCQNEEALMMTCTTQQQHKDEQWESILVSDTKIRFKKIIC